MQRLKDALLRPPLLVECAILGTVAGAVAQFMGGNGLQIGFFTALFMLPIRWYFRREIGTTGIHGGEPKS